MTVKKLSLFFLLCICSSAQGQSINFSRLNSGWLTIDSIYHTEESSRQKELFVLGRSINATNYANSHQLEFILYNNTAQIDSAYFFLGHWINFTASEKVNGITKPLTIIQQKPHTLLQPVLLLKIILQPNQKATYNITPDVRNFNFHYIKPHLVRPNAFNDFAYAYYFEHQKVHLILSFIFIGLMLGMFLYAFISWSKVKTKDYLFYGIYVLFFIFYFLLRILFLFLTSYSYLKHSYYAVHFVQITGYILYAFFLIAFLHLTNKKDFLYILLKWFGIILISYLIVDAFLIYYTIRIDLSIKLFVLIRYFLLLTSVITVIYLFKLKNRLTNYIAWGIAMLFLFGIISLFFSNTDFVQSKYNNFFDLRIPLYQLGITIELVLFTMALQYKSNLKSRESIREIESLRIENEKKEFEAFMGAMQARDNERTRIAQEIHDDIGSGLTSIRLLSEIAKAKNKDKEVAEMEKISTSASELIENMNEIIWSINSKNDNLPNLIAYLRRYVVTYFENFDDITVKTAVPDVIPEMLITGDFRRSIFLVVKEALHNIIKHAQATQVQLRIQIADSKLSIAVIDNGKGFDKTAVRQFSNGLKNMRERIENLGGSFSINSYNGSTVLINLPVMY